MRVQFPEWSDCGKQITLEGEVIGEFREPPEEDRYQRLNYHVRTDDGRVYTPYARDCTEVPVGVEPTNTIVKDKTMNLEPWLATLTPRKAEFTGFQAGYSEEPNTATGQHYSAEPWNEIEGSLYDLSMWFDTAEEAKAAAQEASLRFGHSGVFDDLTSP